MKRKLSDKLQRCVVVSDSPEPEANDTSMSQKIKWFKSKNCYVRKIIEKRKNMVKMSSSPAGKTPSVVSGKTMDSTPRPEVDISHLWNLVELKRFKIDFEKYTVKTKNCDCKGFPCHFEKEWLNVLTKRSPIQIIPQF